MNKWTVVFFLGVCCFRCSGLAPFKPHQGSMPFLVYFSSRYRGLCVGTLVGRSVVLTAAVCVTSPNIKVKDTRPITVVAGTTYRHPLRGIRVQVTKILLPNLQLVTDPSGYLITKSTAILMLKWKVPDILAEIPLRPINIDWRGQEKLLLQEQCLIPGWHFFFKGDKVFPVHKFLLQRNLRVQFMNIVKKNLWCDTLIFKLKNTLSNLGFSGLVDETSHLCIRDTDKAAQPCHGMYGAPLICRGRVVAMMMAPDAQWTNCTGFTNIVDMISNKYLQPFMTCVSRMFEQERSLDWKTLQKELLENATSVQFDYIPEIYDKLYSNSNSDESSDSSEL